MKKENLILTISIGEYYQKLSEYTLPSIKEYAKRIGADFLNITEHNPEYITQKWNKFYIYELLNAYKRIIYLDIDIIVRDDTPNLFDIVPKDKLGMFNEGKYSSRFEFLQQASDYYKEPLRERTTDFYNSGVMVISRIHKQIFKMPVGIDFVETDQPYINLRILNDKVKMFDLNYKFNRMSILDEFVGINRLDSYIVHYAGAPENQIFNVLINDIEKWKNDAPKYEYKRNFVVSVSAGAGDQLCSEPVVRYMKKMYPDDNFHIVTHNPRFFEHIGLPVYTYDQWKGIGDAIIKWWTCPDEKTAGHNLSHVLFHPTDFASLSTIRMTLPNHEKTIKLKLDVIDVATVLERIRKEDKKGPTIVVHAGKWWASKTLPMDWWQEVVDKLSEKYTVCLIGKTIDEKQGYQPIECPENGIDFRDLTTMGELIALISLSRITLTNDSLPLHIAGAFDNWIVTIPTCKHPDHILPFRNGTQYYKTKALYKKLLLDDLEVRFTEIDIHTIDLIPEGHDLYEYIPDVDTIINEVNDIFDNDK